MYIDLLPTITTDEIIELQNQIIKQFIYCRVLETCDPYYSAISVSRSTLRELLDTSISMQRYTETNLSSNNLLMSQMFFDFRRWCYVHRFMTLRKIMAGKTTPYQGNYLIKVCVWKIVIIASKTAFITNNDMKFTLSFKQTLHYKYFLLRHLKSLSHYDFILR